MFGTHETCYCINFGGCYGYDLTVVFQEFLSKKYYFLNSPTAAISIRDITFNYITFLQQNYDGTVPYQEKANAKLLLKLVAIYNKLKSTKIKININKQQKIITNLYLRK